MNNARFCLPEPKNEPVLQYAPGSPERRQLMTELDRQRRNPIEIPLIIAGEEVRTGRTGQCICPHDHRQMLANYHQAGEPEAQQAIAAALAARPKWEATAWSERAAIFLKAAELIATRYRYVLNAATMLNQSKNVFQAEIDAVCELVDFLRFNVAYMQQIYTQQPQVHAQGTWNRMAYRGLEGFVFAVTPFNFTAIAGNLPSAPAMMGNTVIWKPASSAVLAAHHVMRIFREAGLPAGVINFLPGNGSDVGDPVLGSEDLAGVHFTGSTATFHSIWRTIGQRIDTYRNYPRIVGETGGKDFIFVHASADPQAVITAAVRGAFEYQGQKCSAVSRMYVPESFWQQIQAKLMATVGELRVGDVSDFGNFINAVIDEKAFDKIMDYIQRSNDSPQAEILCGGKGDKSKGYFIQPTIILAKDPGFVTLEEEIFGPVLTTYVYPDNAYEETLALCNETSPYGLTGAIFATSRRAVETAGTKLRHAAGNFYINDKPTGSVVGQQPFGGARKSGTNDKAGSPFNLIRWTSPLSIKETFNPPQDYRYPFMGPEHS